MHIFYYSTETGEFFAYIRPKESRSISYNLIGMCYVFCSDSDIKRFMFTSQVVKLASVYSSNFIIMHTKFLTRAKIK